MNSIYRPTSLSYGSVSISKIIQNDYRLDVSAYNMNALNAHSKVVHSKHGFIQLSELIEDAFVGSRFKRIYTDSPKDVPFFIPSDIEKIFPKPTKYISAKTNADIEPLRLKKNMLLITCSGTVGKTSIVGKYLDEQVMSHDLLRVSFKNDYDLGYIYSFFNSEIGLTILQSNNYGAVIDHIEPEHLDKIPIPNASIIDRKTINLLIQESFDLRDESNDLIDSSQKLLYQELDLPDISTLIPKQYSYNSGFNNFTLRLSQTDLRLDGSYHVPIVNEVIKKISEKAERIALLGDEDISASIILPGRFKRVYVKKGHGIPFFGGKQLLSLSPSNLKYLSPIHHGERIEGQLFLKENMCAISCSGTIGKVMIVPKHWEGWTMNQHVIRIVPESNDLAGYIYAWVDSQYCKPLIERYIYGSVLDEIDDEQIAHIPIPIIRNKEKLKIINDNVLKANKLRYKAYLKEQEAFKIMNNIIED